MRWIAGAAAVSFLALVLVSLFGRDLARPPVAGPSTFSTSALGYRGLAELLASLGLGVAARETRAARDTGPRQPLVLAEPDPALAADPTRRLPALAEEAVRRQAQLVLILPKWTGRPLARRPGWIGGLRLRPPLEALRPLALLTGPRVAAGLRLRRLPAARRCTWWGEREEVDLAPAQLLAEQKGLVPLVACRGGVLVGALPLWQGGGQSVLVVADPDLWNDRGLGRAGHAALAQAFFVGYLGASGAVFDETLHGFERAAGIFAAAFRFPLSLALLQALLLLAAILWAGMARFGKPLPREAALAAGKEVLIDNTARLLAAGGHVAASLARYRRQTVRDLAAELHLPAAGEGETRVALARLAAARRLAAPPLGGDDALDAADATAAADPLRAARALYRWRREMEHG